MNNTQQIDKPVATDKSRRSFMVGITAILGATTTAQLLGGKAISVAAAYSPKPNSAKTAGKVFSQTQMSQLENICAVVIPKTDTPSAAEVDAHGFLDNQLFHCHTESQQQQAKSILIKIDQLAIKRFNRSFSVGDKKQQYDLLTSLEKTQNGFNIEDKQNWKLVKGLIVFGYYTSEPGATQELEYLAVPGAFTGSVPYDSVGKGSGSLSYY